MKTTVTFAQIFGIDSRIFYFASPQFAHDKICRNILLIRENQDHAQSPPHAAILLVLSLFDISFFRSRRGHVRHLNYRRIARQICGPQHINIRIIETIRGLRNATGGLAALCVAQEKRCDHVV
jgi:hypothetical protein